MVRFPLLFPTSRIARFCGVFFCEGFQWETKLAIRLSSQIQVPKRLLNLKSKVEATWDSDLCPTYLTCKNNIVLYARPESPAVWAAAFRKPCVIWASSMRWRCCATKGKLLVWKPQEQFLKREIPVIRWIISRALTYSVVIIVNHIVSHTWTLLTE